MAETANRRMAGAVGRRAVTLLEVILAIALIIMLMASVMAFYETSIKARDTGRDLALKAIQTRSMLDRLAEELRHTVNVIPGDGRGFEGTRDSITIVRARLPDASAFNEYEEFDTLPPAQNDVMRVTYTLYWDEEERVDDEGVLICHGVWRTEQRTFDPNPKISVESDEPGEDTEEEVLEFPKPDVNELYAPEIKYLRFEYFDGLKWRDRWSTVAVTADAETGAAPSQDESRALPQAVRITMGRVREPPPEKDDLESRDLQAMRDERDKLVHHPDRFMTVVYLPQSDQSLLSSRKRGAGFDRDEQMGEQTSGGR